MEHLGNLLAWIVGAGIFYALLFFSVRAAVQSALTRHDAERRAWRRVERMRRERAGTAPTPAEPIEPARLHYRRPQ